MAVGKLAGAHGDPALTAFGLGLYEDDLLVRRSLGAGWSCAFERVAPVRPSRWSKGGESLAGWYYAATARVHVGYESWLERDRLIFFDADPEVVGIVPQPFWLHWYDGRRKRRHAPDCFVRLAGGRGRSTPPAGR